MASTEQPLKKRKLSFTSPPPQHPLSHEEIIRRRRNKEEIRSLYESYRRIRFCVSQKDARLMPDFEQAYLSLITASRGCTSVQRIVAELIPRYASFCPTALEAAAKVSINMYNWSLAMVMRGEDGDGVAYQTAKACIFGLVDICSTASYEAPTSSVIDGICSAVFENVLTFFTSTFEGKDIYKISSKEIRKLQETPESFSDLKQEQADNNDPPLLRLFRFRALSLLRIFFSFPKNLLAASFDLVSGGAAVVHRQGGKYFLNQLTSDLDVDVETDSLNKICDGETLSTNSGQNGEDCKGSSKEAKPLSSENNDMEKPLLQPKNCFMKMAIDRESSLRRWMLSRYKKLSESRKSEDISELSSFLEKLFGSLAELVKEANSAESDEYSSDQSKYIDPVFPACKIPVQRVDNDVSISDARHKDNNAAEKDAGKSVKPYQSLLSQKVNFQSGNSGERLVKLESGNREDSYPVKSSPKDLTSSHSIPAATRKQPDFRNNDSDVGYQSVGVEKEQGLNIDLRLPARISASGSVPNILPSPRQLSTTWHHASSNHILWYGNGDPAAMDVFPAAKQLWVGSLGRDASEMLVRLQFEDFGPLEQFIFVPSKDFALIEYKNIMDAVKAREYMHGSSPWGSCLHIKFLDRGLGSRGATNGIAIGDSCHVYVGKVSTQWAKDEILHELMVVGMRNPRLVTDLANESALLLEFGTSEEAVIAMTHIRRQRNESGRHTYPEGARTMRGCSKVDSFASSCQLLVKQIDASVSDEELINAFSRFGEITRWKFNRLMNCCLIDFRSYEFAELAKSHLHGARFGSTSILVEFATDSPQTMSNPVAFSPRTASVHDNTIGSSGIRIVNTSGYTSSHGDFYPPNMEGKPMNSYHSSFMYKPEPEHSIRELVSPRVLAEKPVSQIHNMHVFQSSWSNTSSSEMLEIRSRRANMFGSSTPLDHSFADPATPRAQQVWQYKKQEMAPGSIPCPPIGAHGGSMIPPPVPASSFVRPVYPSPSGSWDNSATHPSFSLNQVLPGMNPADHRHINVRPAIPFIPSSITPLSQLPGGSMQNFDHMSTAPGSSSRAPPPPPDTPPPLPSSPPPLPLSHPPSVPPPPTSPLRRPVVEPSHLQLGEPLTHYQWQGTLSKSGVHYCTIYATREESSACNYSNAVSEPVEWPARLDVTKRTDLRHVKTTFASTMPHRREVCRLLPSTTSDHKGFHDFISYLKQRDCAGVIKIPAGKFMWSRLLFILPHSPDTCSLFGISPHPADCLIALVLPKDTNTEGA